MANPNSTTPSIASVATSATSSAVGPIVTSVVTSITTPGNINLLQQQTTSPLTTSIITSSTSNNSVTSNLPTTTATAITTATTTTTAVASIPATTVVAPVNHQVLASLKPVLPPHQQTLHPQSLQAQTPIGLASASLHQLQQQSSSVAAAASSTTPSTSITLSNSTNLTTTDSSNKTNNTKTTTATPSPLSKTFSAVIQAHQQNKQSPQTVLISLTTKSNATTLQQIQQLQTSLNHPPQHSLTPPPNASIPQTYSVYAQQQNTAQVAQLVTTQQQQQIQSQQPQQSQQQTKAQSQQQQSFKYICCLQENGVRCDRAAGNASYSRRVQKTVGLRKLNYTLDPTVRHAYICEYHKTVIQSARKSPAHAREMHGATTATTTNRNNFNDISPISARQQNVGLLTQHQLNNHGVTLVAPNNSSVRAAAAVGYSHYPGPSIGPIDALPPSLDSGDNGSTSSAMDVDLYQLQVNTLRRYKRHFRVQTRPGLNKLQLADSLKRHFKTMPIIEKEAITYFVYIVKCNRNKLDHNLKNSNASNQLSNDD